MLAPLDAISLASSIVQIVDFSNKIIKESYEVYQSERGAAKESEELQKTTKRLQDLSVRLPDLRDGKGRKKSREERDLDDLSAECEKQAAKLLQILDGLKVTSTGAQRKIGAVKSSLKRHSKAHEMEEIQKNLQRIQGRMDTTLLAIIRNDQSHTMQSLSEIATISKTMHFSSQRLIESKFTALQAVLLEQDRRSKKATDRHEALLQEILTRLDSLQAQAASITLSQIILTSLEFSEMHVRHQQIHKEHKHTFSWIFHQTHFRQWLESGTGTFWISGKAGSGKSTLMKFIASHLETNQLLDAWAVSEKGDLIKAKHFFWHAGSTLQKSHEGLLQSLVHQIFKQFPEIIELTAPERRWNANLIFHESPEPWSLDELAEVLINIVEHDLSRTKCFCFIIDGLDEYLGDHGRLIDMLSSLENLPHVKLCVSSRPWNVFKDAYGNNDLRNLFVHEHTKPDMDRYIRDHLEEDKRFKALVLKDPQIMELATIIRDRAMGVFLWVYLVVRRLSRLIGEMQHMHKVTRVQTLRAALDELPSDLDDYFKHIIDNIEKIHRTHTAGTFKLAIYAAPLPLIAFWNLPSVMEQPETILDAPFESEDDDTEFIVRTTDTINAWCKDLLEVIKINDTPTAGNELDYRIDFLHRTVKDFLQQNQEVQQMFSYHLKPTFEPGITLLWLHLAQTKVLNVSSGSDDDIRPFTSVASTFLRLARTLEAERQEIDPRMFSELERAGNLYRMQGMRQNDESTVKIWSHWTNAIPKRRLRYIDISLLGQTNFLALCISYGLESYVRQRLESKADDLNGAAGAVLLNYALHSAFHVNEPSYDIVMLLLQAGANPNLDVNGKQSSSNTAWKLFLVRCCDAVTYEEFGPLVKLLLQFGADPDAVVKSSGTTVTRARVSSTFAGRSTTSTTTVRITIEECVAKCCDTKQLEGIYKSLDLARQRQGKSKILEESKQTVSSFLGQIGRNLVPSQRRR